jgi:hypothetical protein
LRYAAKAMNGTKYLKKNWQHHWSDLTLTSSGLQPFGHCNYKSRSERKNQTYFLESICSNWLLSFIVFAAWDTYTADRINKMFDLTNTIRDMKTKAGKITVKCF